MVKKNFAYILLVVILVFALFLRVYRIGTVLGFYFDQGRDALVISDLIHFHKFFLIGPTTGLAGIFRGPYYYYLIAPFYFLGRGNPVWPSVFLSFTTILSIVLIYYLGFKISGKVTGLIAATIAGLSFYIVIASRWLSNPTPMLLLSMLLVLAMYKISQETKKTKVAKWWVVLSLVSGLSLFNFGSSGEFFYFPALLIFAIWQRKKWPNLKYFLLSIFAFTLTFAPLVLFDFKHGHILINNFFGTFGGDGGSFKPVTSFVFNERNKAYWDIFTNKLFDARGKTENIIFVVVIISFFISLRKFLKNNGTKILILLLLSPIIGLYFYQGNYGVLYDYYMTGYYLIFILLFAVVMGVIWKSIPGKIFVIYFLYLFFNANVPLVMSRISDNCDAPTSICFVNQKQAIDWIYNDAKNQNFNVDVYVPPKIAYAYDYLLRWKFNPNFVADPKQVSLLYTLYEVDPPHPERLDAWLARQKGIGIVSETTHFGGITVERRTRIVQKK